MKGWSLKAREHVFKQFREERWRAPEHRWHDDFRKEVANLSGKEEAPSVDVCEAISRAMQRQACKNTKKAKIAAERVQAANAVAAGALVDLNPTFSPERGEGDCDREPALAPPIDNDVNQGPGVRACRCDAGFSSPATEAGVGPRADENICENMIRGEDERRSEDSNRCTARETNSPNQTDKKLVNGGDEERKSLKDLWKPKRVSRPTEFFRPERPRVSRARHLIQKAEETVLKYDPKKRKRNEKQKARLVFNSGEWLMPLGIPQTEANTYLIDETKKRKVMLRTTHYYASGGGDMRGAFDAGFEPILWTDMDATAERTILTNEKKRMKGRTIIADMDKKEDVACIAESRRKRKFKDVAVAAGGPSCKGFSGCNPKKLQKKWVSPRNARVPIARAPSPFVQSRRAPPPFVQPRLTRASSRPRVPVARFTCAITS